MGGVPCWKQVIDNFNALIQQGNCMAESIRIAGSVNGSGVMPTDAQRDLFIKKSSELADVMADIQKSVGGGQ